MRLSLSSALRRCLVKMRVSISTGKTARNIRITRNVYGTQEMSPTGEKLHRCGTSHLLHADLPPLPKGRTYLLDSG